MAVRQSVRRGFSRCQFSRNLKWLKWKIFVFVYFYRKFMCPTVSSPISFHSNRPRGSPVRPRCQRSPDTVRPPWFPRCQFPRTSQMAQMDILCVEHPHVSGGAVPCPLHSDRPQSGGRDTVRTRRQDASSAASRCPCTRLGQQQPSTTEPPARLMRGPRRAALREDHRGAVHPARRLRPRGRPRG